MMDRGRKQHGVLLKMDYAIKQGQVPEQPKHVTPKLKLVGKEEGAVTAGDKALDKAIGEALKRGDKPPETAPADTGNGT